MQYVCLKSALTRSGMSLLSLLALTVALSACRPSIDDNLPETSASTSPGNVSAADLQDGSVTPAKLSQAYLPLAGGTLSGAINMGGQALTNLAAPSASTDAATKSYVDAAISDTAYSHSSAASQAVQWSSTSVAPSQAQVKALVEAMTPSGTVQAYVGSTAPTGWLLCDGSAVSRTTYARLFAVMGVTHGQGDGSTTFNLPDYRGRFLRMLDGAAGRDPDAASRTAMGAGGNTGNTVGSVQTDAFQGHRHYRNTSGASETIVLSAAGGHFQSLGAQFSFINSNSTGDSITNGTNGTPRTASETRPVNAYVNYIIKY